MNYLRAYRFNDEELNAMLQLKNLFVCNNFEINRFPEVYYDDYENFSIDLDIDDQEEGTPDYLGVYFYDRDDVNSEFTDEGRIILYKNRIEDFSRNNKIEVNDVRFIVLMHEMGHWLSHWPRYNNKNWSFGFAAKNKKTKESLAQLIAYWMVNGSINKEFILRNYLTPKNILDPYALYLNLLHKSKSSILKKLVLLRENYFLSDEIMCHLLELEDDKNIFDYLISIFYSSFKMPPSLTKVFNDSDFPPSTRDFSTEIVLLENEDTPITFDDLLMLCVERIFKSGENLGKFVSSIDEQKKRIGYFYDFEDSYTQEYLELFSRYSGKITGEKYGL
jgi:hypothetical protein